MPIRLTAALILLLCHAAIAGDPSRPNIILIVADDLGGADLGCYGSTFHKTPHLDQLAADGLRFTQAYSACPVCSPTRACLMTGKHPARLHLTDWLPGRPDRPDQMLLRPALRQQLPLEEVTIAEVLQSAGYATGHIGKWHLGGAGFEPQKQGFDINIAGDQTGTPLSYFAPFRRGQQQMPGLEQAPEGEYLTDRLATEAERFLEAHREKPFFLYLPHYAVHTPLQAPQDRIARFPQERVPGKQSNAIYAAMLQALDDCVGRLRQKLDDLKLSSNTVIVFTSDNGGLATGEGRNTPATINTPYREGKGFLYEGGIRVPLLVLWPGVTKAGSANPTPVFSGDIPVTIAEIAGLTPGLEEMKLPGLVDGMSLAGLLRGTESLPARPLFWHYPHYANQGSRPGAAIRAGDWKLIEFYETGRRELFDVEHDVGENRNVAEENPEIVERLAKQLAQWRESVGAQMMRPNPDYVPNPQAADGKIVLPAINAHVHGRMLRVEPLPHKNTLGYWVRPEDYATWEFTVTKPGTFAVEILQGCGKDNGGSVVEFSVGHQALSHTVEDTGHFQNFVPRTIGEFRLDNPGRFTLTVRARTKAAAAVMDLRQVTLSPR